MNALAAAPLFDALAAFHRDHPHSELEPVEENYDQPVARVRSGSLDVALVGLAGDPPERLTTQVITNDRLIALTPPGSELAHRGRTALADLFEYSVLSLPVGTGIRNVLDQACAALNIDPAVALVATSPDTVAGLARRGPWVAVLGASMADAYPDLAAVPIDGAEIPALLALVWPERTSPALTVFLRHCREAFRGTR
ncbi:LysR substrate-binding domain-containing protein [Micromonospora sp. NPDC047670]|uniref:LysR substrate-binding domain-containing protein n=1 Tax=Micromonospora sp. NPDC047670 TaxID=3364252 RepID=UPI0037190815